MSFAGIAVLLLIAILLSDNRKAINLRTVGGAFIIQFLLGAFVLYIPVGRDVLYGMSQAVANIIAYGNVGINFLFGGLTSNEMFKLFGSGGFVFALRVLPVIVFFSALISILYYLGVMRFVINILGGSLRKVLGISHAESISATANIFVGLTEAPLVIRPFIPKMTQSELFTICVGGMASVAGGVLAGYAQMGVPLEYLIAASFMAAPGGLLFAKIIKPETEKLIKQLDDHVNNVKEKPENIFDAAAVGASSGMQLALNVGAMLLAFIGLIALVNGMLGGIGSWFGIPQLTLELILGYIFSPLAFLMGVPWGEAQLAGSFIGQKIVVNEFVAYINFAPYLKDVADGGMLVAQTGSEMSNKTKAIISFALCGFANLSSIAVLLGGIGSLAPTRRAEIARFGMKAVAAGTLSNLMSATIAGLFIALAAS